MSHNLKVKISPIAARLLDEHLAIEIQGLAKVSKALHVTPAEKDVMAAKSEAFTEVRDAITAAKERDVKPG